MMDRVSIRDRKFTFGIHCQDEIECIIVNASQVQRAYYEGEYDPNNPQVPICWSSDTQRPDDEVPKRQATRCMDCKHDIRGSAPNGGRACRFSQKLAVLFENDYAVHQLHVPANSIFGRQNNGHMPLQEYARFLSKNDTSCVSVYTKIISLSGMTQDKEAALKSAVSSQNNHLKMNKDLVEYSISV